jgi:hypothetical protein
MERKVLLKLEMEVENPVLHIKNTHFDSIASVVITKVASVAFCSQVSQVSKKAYYHDAYVMPITT